jgi:chromosome segregation ATPase
MANHNQQWMTQKKGNWLINLIFGCKQNKEAYIFHLQHLEAVIQDLTRTNNNLKLEFETLKVDYRKLREENFELKIDIAQKEKQLEELTEVMENKNIAVNKSLNEVVKTKRRVKF